MNYIYEIDSLKDDLEELEENYRLVQKELKSKTRQHDSLKRDYGQLEEKFQFEQANNEAQNKTQEEQKQEYLSTIQQLEEELENHKKLLEKSERVRQDLLSKQSANSDDINATRETNKQTREYLYKWKMAEQEKLALQTTVNRLENQVSRYKESIKEAETLEDELKAEKRKMLRELREAQAKIEELETNNSHLQKRIDRMRSRDLLANNVASANDATPPPSLNK